ENIGVRGFLAFEELGFGISDLVDGVLCTVRQQSILQPVRTQRALAPRVEKILPVFFVLKGARMFEDAASPAEILEPKIAVFANRDRAAEDLARRYPNAFAVQAVVG